MHKYCIVPEMQPSNIYKNYQSFIYSPTDTSELS